MKRQGLLKESPRKQKDPQRGRKQVKPAPQLPEGPNEAPHRAPPLHPPVPEDDRGDSQE